MTFTSIQKVLPDGSTKWYIHEFTRDDIGTWYDSSRGKYSSS